MQRERMTIVRYRWHDGMWHPIMEFGIAASDNVVRVTAYVDTGAYVSIFRPRVAQALGMDIERGRLIHVRSVNGTLIPVWLHHVTILIGRWRIPAMVGFCERLGVGFNLLGRKDVFQMLAFTFNDRQRKLTITDAA
ncbi:MAG TPA: hypothetical protein EYP10_04740 [Armatimonadetes bacterium]|nr:hypothetical protein [Armatimonadota bacterium]